MVVLVPVRRRSRLEIEQPHPARLVLEQEPRSHLTDGVAGAHRSCLIYVAYATHNVSSTQPKVPPVRVVQPASMWVCTIPPCCSRSHTPGTAEQAAVARRSLFWNHIWPGG
jgi:hypothetical protein